MNICMMHSTLLKTVLQSLLKTVLQSLSAALLTSTERRPRCGRRTKTSAKALVFVPLMWEAQQIMIVRQSLIVIARQSLVVYNIRIYIYICIRTYWLTHWLACWLTYRLTRLLHTETYITIYTCRRLRLYVYIGAAPRRYMSLYAVS